MARAQGKGTLGYPCLCRLHTRRRRFHVSHPSVHNGRVGSNDCAAWVDAFPRCQLDKIFVLSLSQVRKVIPHKMVWLAYLGSQMCSLRVSAL